MLFGHQNDDTTQSAGTPPPPPPAPTIEPTVNESLNPLAVDPATGVSLPTAPTADDDATSSSVLDQPVNSSPIIESDVPAMFETTPEPTPPSFEPSASESTPDVADEAPESAQTDLLAMKQQALAQLSPLVSQLDQTPEEKFRTTMMLLQSTDNSALIKDAYDAAQAIPDEKTRAQALLDVVNEINYFTQQK